MTRSTRYPLFLSATALLACALTACGDGGRDAAAPARSTDQDAPPAAGPIEAARATTPRPAPTSGPTGPLPLIPGVYVSRGEDCARPANAGFRIYNGRGISGSATRGCEATVVSQDGPNYRIEQSCVDTYSGERTTTGGAVEVSTPRAFTLTGSEGGAATYSLCPADAPPSYLRDLVTAE